MKKLLVAALAAIGMMIGTGAFAQKPMHKSAEEMARTKADKLRSELSLTEQQTKQVYDYFLQNGEQARENMQQKMEQTNATMKQVLTPEQYEKWQKMQGHRADKRKEIMEHKADGKHSEMKSDKKQMKHAM